MQTLYAVQMYVPFTDDCLNYIAHYKISNTLKNIRLQIFHILKEQNPHLSWHPECTKYFLELNEYSTYFHDFENEPRDIVKFKKILNLWVMLENILAEVETTNSIFQYETVARFHSIQTQIHEAVRLLLDLSSDFWGGATENTWIFADLQNVMMDVLGIFQTSTSQYHPRERIFNLHQKMLSILEHLKNGYQIAEDIGFVAGMCVDLLPPGKNTHFIGQLISLVPYSLDQLTKNLKFVTEHLAVEQAHIPMQRWYELENHLEQIVSSLSNMENTAVSIGSNAITMIYNLRLVFDFCKEVAQNIGHFCPETQTLFKDKIRLLKFDWLTKLMVSVDNLELQWMLKEGSFSDHVWPYIENMYQTMIGMMSHVIEFTEQDHDIYWLREATWNEAYIQAHLKNQVTNVINKRSIQQIIQNFDQYDSWDLALEFNNKYAEIAPYLMKIDAKMHNRILHVIVDNSDKREVFRDLQHSKSRVRVRQALEQEYQQYNFMHNMMVSRIQAIEAHAQKDLSFIGLSKDIDIDQLVTRFKGRYALVMIKKPVSELATWFWVDKNRRSVMACAPDALFHALKRRPWIEGNPQKLTLSEIHRVEGLVSKKCDADMPLLHETPIAIHGEQSLDDVYFQFLMMQRAYFRGCDFFNGLEKVIRKNQRLTDLGELEKQALQNALNGFQHLVSIDTSLTVDAIQRLKRNTLSFLKEGITKLEHRFQQLYQEKRHQQVHVLEIVEREDYFIKSKRFSTMFKEIQTYFSQIFQIYTDSVQSTFPDVPGNIFPNLHTPDLILLEPQQVVEQKLVYNILGQLKAFCEILESYQIANFDEHYLKLHLDIITGFLNFSNLTFYYFKPAHHFDLITRFKNIFTDRLQKASINWDYYGPGVMNLPVDQQPFQGIYEWVHRLYSLPPIIQNLNESTQLSEAQVRAMRQQFAKVSKDVVNLMKHTNLYWWLLWHVPSISKLLVGIKDKYQEACLSLHTKTIDNLYNLKEMFFKELLIECDQIELDLGIKPQYFSDQVSMMVDICFGNLLRPLDFDIAKFLKLILKDDLEPIRKEALLAKKHEIQLHQSALQSQLDDILHFNSNESRYAFKKILPYLVKYNACRAYPNPNDILSAATIEQDKKYRRWINEICDQDIGIQEAISANGQLPNFNTNAYNDIHELINFVKNAIQGLIATDDLKLTICDEKIQHLEAKIVKNHEDIPLMVVAHIHEQFNQNIRLMIARMPFSSEVLQLYSTDFIEHMNQHRAGIIDHINPIVTTQMEQITSIRAQDNTFAGVSSEAFYQQMNQAAEIFVQQYYQDYCQLHDMLIELEAFEEYVAIQQEMILAHQFVWFENQSTLALKAEVLKNLRSHALNNQTPIKDRLADLKNTISSPDFKQHMCAFALVKDWGITLFMQYFWQWMSWLGLYQFEQDKLYQNLHDELNDYLVEPIEISRYGLFVERHALYQDDFIQTVREGLNFQ